MGESVEGADEGVAGDLEVEVCLLLGGVGVGGAGVLGDVLSLIGIVRSCSRFIRGTSTCP